MKHIIIVLACLSISSVLKAQNKNYQVAAISFYNFENCFDTINDPKKMDEDFLPNGPYHYTKEVYYRKLHNLATVISQLGTELTPDGPAILGTAEIESALVAHKDVAEAAVVGAADEMTGQGIVAFVILRSGIEHANGDALVKELRAHVTKEIGAIARPRQIMVVNELPKTRSGKIMRRLLKDVAENRAVGDATTLADPNVMKLIAEGLHSSKDED